MIKTTLLLRACNRLGKFTPRCSRAVITYVVTSALVCIQPVFAQNAGGISPTFPIGQHVAQHHQHVAQHHQVKPWKANPTRSSGLIQEQPSNWPDNLLTPKGFTPAREGSLVDPWADSTTHPMTVSPPGSLFSPASPFLFGPGH